LFFLSSILPVVNSIYVEKSTDTLENEDLPLQVYKYHIPIRINSNQELKFHASFEGWPGTGTEHNPYVIEDFEINSEGHNDAIFIGNVTDYFMIRNCYLHNASGLRDNYHGNNGIYLYKTKNGIIEDNIILNNQRNGILLYMSNSNTINRNQISNWNYGLYFDRSSDNIISNNNIYDNGGDGSYIYYDSNRNTFIGNTFSNNGRGIRIELTASNVFINNTLIKNGFYIWANTKFGWSSHSIDTTNMVNGKSIYYLKDKNNGSISSATGQIILVNSKNIVIENQNISDQIAGIEIAYCSNITLRNNNFSKNEHGLIFTESNLNNILNNTCFNNKWGFDLSGSSNNILSGNNVFNTKYESIKVSNNNIVSGNNISNNFKGVILQGDNNFIINNTISNNMWGIHCYNSANDNIIYHNYLLENEKQGYDEGDNQWDNGFPCGGNYWSDYREKYPDAKEINDTGIWDIPYEGNGFIDRYPLMREPFFEVEITSPKHSILFPIMVNKDDEVSIGYTIENTGEAGEEDVIFIFNNSEKDRDTIILYPNESYHGEFHWNTEGVTEGFYKIEIISDNDVDTAPVIVSSKNPVFKIILLLKYWLSLL